MAFRFVSFECLVTVAICYAFISDTNCNIIRNALLNHENELTKFSHVEEKVTTSGSETKEPSACQSCSSRKEDLTDEDLREIRFEIIKSQILQKLQMTHPPCLQDPKPNIHPVILATRTARNGTEFSQNETPQQNKLESVVVFPRNSEFFCAEDSAYPCASLRFELPDDISRDAVFSSKLWLYPINVKSNLKLSEKFGPLLPTIELPFEKEEAENDWINFDFGDAITWLNYDGHLNFNVELQCDSDCDSNGGFPVALEDDKMPFLITYSWAPKPTARKRSVDCQGSSSSCCRESFHISFADIGWNNWILYPEGYKANLCKGKCLNDISNTRYYHSTVLYSYIKENRDNALDMGLTMCCTPSEMSPLDIIYTDENGNIFYRTLSNMIVESCDCA